MVKDVKAGILHSLPIVIGILIAYAYINIMYHPVIVSGESMSDTLHSGDVLETTINISEIKRNDIITFKNKQTGHQTYIKRVIGLPGETIEIKYGHVYIDGEELDEPYDVMESENMKVELGNNEYFVLGDNRNGSTDSRVIGPIAHEDIKSVVEQRIFSRIL